MLTVKENDHDHEKNGYKFYDSEKLSEGLNALTGKDFQEAEAAARRSGDQTLDICMSRTFHAALAAKCFGVPLPEITKVSIREYARITNDVAVFLLAEGQGTEISLPNTGA